VWSLESFIFHFESVDNSVEDISDFRYFLSADYLLGRHSSELFFAMYTTFCKSNGHLVGNVKKKKITMYPIFRKRTGRDSLMPDFCKLLVFPQLVNVHCISVEMQVPYLRSARLRRTEHKFFMCKC